jgi:putative transposase
MEILKSFKFRIYPTKEQKNFLANQFGGVRFIYNFFLNRRKEEYLINKKSSNYHKDAKYLTELKQKDGYEWLYDISAQSCQQSLRHLEVAYTRFFNKKSRFPKFKKTNSNQSYKMVQAFLVEKNILWIPKLKNGIKIKQDRDLPSKPSSVTISSTPSGKYYASFCCKIDQELLPKSENKIGIDFGIKDLVITSNGHHFKNQKLTKQFEKKLANKQRKLSKKKKGSNNRNKARIEVAKVYEKIKFKRLDYLHKISRKLINENQVIIAEDLNISGMMKNHKLSKAIQDASWYELIRQLQYKAEWYGRTFYQISTWFPSSKTCSECHYVMDKMPLDIRSWICPCCNTKHDRDVNAAKNILNKGLKDLEDLSKGLKVSNAPHSRRLNKIEKSGLGTKSDSKQKLGEALSSVKKKLKKSSKQDGSMKQEILIKN